MISTHTLMLIYIYPSFLIQIVSDHTNTNSNKNKILFLLQQGKYLISCKSLNRIRLSQRTLQTNKNQQNDNLRPLYFCKLKYACIKSCVIFNWKYTDKIMTQAPTNNQLYFPTFNKLKRMAEFKESVKYPQFAKIKSNYKTQFNKNILTNNNSQKNIINPQKPAMCSFQKEMTRDLRKNGSCSILKQKIMYNKQIIEKSLNLMKQIKANLSTSSVKKELPSLIKKSSIKTNYSLNVLTQSLQNPEPKIQTRKITIFPDPQKNQQKSHIRQQQVEYPQYFVLKIKDKVQIFLSLKYLDSGSFGKIILVQHVATGFIMCLKIYSRAMFSQDTLNQLFRQIKIQSCLNHPNIVTLYGFAVDTENVYLLMQACLGSNAFKKLSQKPIFEKQAKKYIKEVSSAIQYLHNMQILHRDIKAQNVVFHENVAKICDFGWAVRLSDYRSTQCGTPVYLAPQIIKCQNYDSKIDVWSVGVLTYELLFGKNPFQIRNLKDLQNIIQNEVQFQDHVQLTAKAKEFIRLCLAKLPSQRLTIGQCLQHQFLAAESPQFRSPTNKK